MTIDEPRQEREPRKIGSFGIERDTHARDRPDGANLTVLDDHDRVRASQSDANVSSLVSRSTDKEPWP